jgi:signal transduction histidine kinase
MREIELMAGHEIFPSTFERQEPAEEKSDIHRETPPRELSMSYDCRSRLAALAVLLVGGFGAFLLSRRKSRANALLAARQLDAVSLVSHELCNSIAIVLAAGENLRDGLVQSDDALRAQGHLIATHAERLKALAERVLLGVRPAHPPDEGEVHGVQVSEAIDDALQSAGPVLREKKFIVEQRIPSALPRARCELPALSRCLQNLLSNAVKYSGRGRWVGVSVECLDDCDSAAAEIRIHVADHGMGIPEEDLENIFKPFYRVRARHLDCGAGLGLAIAKQDVESFGGTLSVESRENQGSTFTIHLPVSEEMAFPPDRNEQCEIEVQYER